MGNRLGLKPIAIFAFLLLFGCDDYMSNDEISRAAKACIESGGAPDFGRAGRYNGGPIYKVTCYGDGYPSVTYSDKRKAEEDAESWERICDGVGRRPIRGAGGDWTCELIETPKTESPNWTASK